MAHAGRKHIGRGAKGKGSGAGGMTDIPDHMLGENSVLKNRDKASHTEGRGLDSHNVQNEQLRDHSANRD
jgi:hypothetical protein